jgi:NADH dehydrogenase [ubiquinone] 1 alpha subcomplex assembly factor 2
MRRIVHYPSHTHYSEVSITPQWHQWLRHTRADPPSLTEQSQDLVRQRNLKILAAEADARWASKPSFLDAPGDTRQRLPATQPKDPGGYAPTTEPSKKGVRNAVDGIEDNAGRIDKESAVSKEEGVSPPTMQQPDGERHPFNRRADGTKAKNKSAKEDPWKQVRGGPSEGWQPEAWNPNALSPKR